MKGADLGAGGASLGRSAEERGVCFATFKSIASKNKRRKAASFQIVKDPI
jgi:hypothetical protein